MLAIRFLSGPQAGQVFNLKSGKNRMGRSSQSDILISSQGISKDHLEIQVFADKVILTDLRSSNGTFVNGTRVQNALLNIGDKIGAHNILFEVIQPQVISRPASIPSQVTPAPRLAPDSAMPVQQTDWSEGAQQSQQQMGILEPTLFDKVKAYHERVVLPGIYRLSEVFEFRFLVMGFAAVFILLVTVLSVIPMKQITSESTLVESLRRSQTVARALAQANEKVIRSGDLSRISVDFVLREDGIDDVYIVSKDGSIVAPPERAGSKPKQISFIKKILGQTRELAAEVGGDRVAAAYPIVAFDSELQQNVAKAYAVVVFNAASLQFDDGRALSLFIQMLVIASMVGGVLFFLMYQLIEHPWHALNKQLDTALRDNHDHVQMTIKLPILQPVLVNINSLLVRALHPQSQSSSGIEINRDVEMKNLATMIGFPALIFDRNARVVAVNSPYESLTGIQAFQIFGQELSQIPDQALVKNIEYLMGQVKEQSHSIFSDSFEISGHQLKINCQGFVGSQGQVEYYMIVMTPPEQMSQGGAA